MNTAPFLSVCRPSLCISHKPLPICVCHKHRAAFTCFYPPKAVPTTIFLNKLNRIAFRAGVATQARKGPSGKPLGLSRTSMGPHGGTSWAPVCEGPGQAAPSSLQHLYKQRGMVISRESNMAGISRRMATYMGHAIFRKGQRASLVCWLHEPSLSWLLRRSS